MEVEPYSRAEWEKTELAEAMDTLDGENMKTLDVFVKQIHKNLNGVKTDTVSGKKAVTKKKTKPTAEEKFRSVVLKMESALSRYEETEEIDNWSINFKAGEYYGDKTFNQLKEIHKKLIDVGTCADKIKLLAFVERGSMYYYLKSSDERFGRWSDVCHELDICRRTVDRYINFFHIMSMYPRLLVCQLSFEAIMTMYKMLQEYLQAHESLAGRLQQPLKQVRVGGGTIFSSHRLPGGRGSNASEVPENLSPACDWDPLWAISDELYGTDSE